MRRADIDLGALSWGAFFVAGGVIFLMKALDIWDAGSDVIWPAILIALGAATIARGIEIEQEKGLFGQSPEASLRAASIEPPDRGRYSDPGSRP